MYNIAHIRFGQCIIAFLCENQATLDCLRLHFNEDLSNSPADISVVIAVDPTADTSSLVPGTRYAYSVNNNEFNFGPNLIHGSWDPAEETCHLLVSDSLLKTEEIWLFNRFLCRIFYTWFMEKNTKDNKAVIIHSSGILRNGKGYIFFGPPESGKSTVASLSRKFEVLHDDMNLVSMNAKGIFVQGISFNPRHLEFTDSSGTMSMIFSLHKNDKVKIERGTQGEFMKMILPEIALPWPLYSDNRKNAFNYLFGCVKKLGKSIPYYRLYFRKDESFWQVIDEMEEINGRHKKLLHQAN